MVWQLHRPLLWQKSREEIRPDLHSLYTGCSQVLAPTSQALKWSGCMLQPNSPLLSLTPTATAQQDPAPQSLCIAWPFPKNSSSVLGTTQSLVSLWVQISLWAWGLSWPLSLNCNQLSSNLLPPLQLHHLPIISHNKYSFFCTKWSLSWHILEFPFKAEPIMKD